MAIDESPDSTELTVPLGDGATASLAIRDDASASECAALAAAMGAHLADRRRAAAVDADGPDLVDRWKLADRLSVRDSDRLPPRVRRGEEWKVAGRIRE